MALHTQLKNWPHFWGTGVWNSTFGIPCSPTSQAIIERTHHTRERISDQQKGGMAQAMPQMRLSKALYAFNFLNSSFAEANPPIFRRFSNSTQAKLKGNPPALVQNSETGQTEGLFCLITWGKGFACVPTGVGPQWIPAKNVHAQCPMPDLQKLQTLGFMSMLKL